MKQIMTMPLIVLVMSVTAITLHASDLEYVPSFRTLPSSKARFVETAEVREGRIKAATLFYLAHDIRHISGGESKQEYVICVLGNDPLNTFIELTVAGKVVQDRSIIVHQSDSVYGCRCDMLFLGDMDLSVYKAALVYADKTDTITVENDHRGGSLVTIFEHQNRLRLRIDSAAAESHGFSLDQDLLDALR